MNIVVIVIDTLRYDYIGAQGNDWIQTPNLDRLAAESWAFQRCFTASYPTIPHRTDALTAKYGAPFHPWQPLAFDAPTLPRALAEGGYCTQLIHDTPHLVNGGHNFDWPFHAWTFVRGAEVDRPWIDSHSEGPQNWTRDPLFDVGGSLQFPPGHLTYVRANRKRNRHEEWSCAKLFLTASEWLADNATRDNFFLWLDCFDPHEPWDAPPEFVKMYDQTPDYDGRIDPRSFYVRNNPDLSEDAKARIRACYAAKVSWVDRWLGEFLDTLDGTGLAGNTAVLLTADHGTNVGERGRFGKGYPVREQEAHVPLLVRVPGGGTGRSSVIVQPQDILATVMGLAGLPVPQVEGRESHDVLAIAREGGEGQRRAALAGPSADRWKGHPDETLFSVFGDEFYLEFAARPERCRLTRYGSLDDVAAGNESIVAEMREWAMEEIERRGAAPALVSWLRSEGEADFPEECPLWDGWPGPRGFCAYFSRLYGEP